VLVKPYQIRELGGAQRCPAGIEERPVNKHKDVYIIMTVTIVAVIMV
jgi:hypothetical protein